MTPFSRSGRCFGLWLLVLATAFWWQTAAGAVAGIAGETKALGALEQGTSEHAPEIPDTRVMLDAGQAQNLAQVKRAGEERGNAAPPVPLALLPGVFGHAAPLIAGFVAPGAQPRHDGPAMRGLGARAPPLA